MEKAKPVSCPEHGEKCIVTMPGKNLVMRVHCVSGDRCLDAYYAVPPPFPTLYLTKNKPCCNV